jgi:hypothetical protein
LQNQLFHPFSQENPLQTGTGLGLAIVNSIVRSESVGGKVDVWSEEGVGTEIKVTFMAETLEDENTFVDSGPMKFDDCQRLPMVSLVGFDETHEGSRLLSEVLTAYLTSWWGFGIQPANGTYGDIVLVNDDLTPVIYATENRDTSRPFIVFSASRGSPKIMTIASDHERIGGFCRIVYKPGGPSRFRSVLKLSLHALKISRSRQQSRCTSAAGNSSTDDDEMTSPFRDGAPRRNSEEINSWPRTAPHRPHMAPRSSTAHPLTPGWGVLPSTPEKDGDMDRESLTSSNSWHGSDAPTVSVGSGGTLLRSSVGRTDNVKHRFRVLVVEDNSILRNLLCAFCSL